MNLEKLNLVELNAQEVVEVEGGLPSWFRRLLKYNAVEIAINPYGTVSNG
jgi:hypothetical protein